MPCEVREHVRADEIDPVGKPVVGDVALGDRERVESRCRPHRRRFGVGVREQYREAAGARAEVERRRDALGRADVRRESFGQELGDEGPRNEHALVDVEAEIAEPGFVRQVGGGHALVDPPLEQLRDLRALGLRQPRIEERFETIERQVQRVQQQVGRFVVGVGRAVAEGEPRLAETRHRVAQPVAQRLEVVCGVLIAYNSGVSSRSRMPGRWSKARRDRRPSRTR